MEILALGAHPDDVEFGCGGTLARLVEGGAVVRAVCLTSGEAGGLGVSRDALAQTRRAEARAAAACLGLREVSFLGFPDGLTAVTREMKVELIGLIRRLRPGVVFSHARSDSVPDHQILGALVRDAVTSAGGPWFADATGEPHRVVAFYGYEVWHPIPDYQTAVDVTAWMPRKREALACHRSQLRDIDYGAAADGLARYRGALSGVGHHAEVFEVERAPLFPGAR